MELSVVIPVFNEETNIREVYQRVAAELESVACGFEIIFIDDGSTDSSVDQIASLHRLDPRVKLLSLSRNFGHQTAITAGMDHALGDAVIAMDADLQHPPALIGELLAHWKDGYEVVYTVRKDTQDATTLKRLSAKFFYRVFSALSGIDIPANSADFRLLDRRVVEAFRQIRERTRFLRGLVSWAGFRSIAVPYDAPARHSGTSKYVLYARLVTGNVVPGWTSLIILVSFVGGIQLIIMGIIGVYIGKIYEETKQRPLYLIRDTLGLENTDVRPARVPFSESAKS
jgi:polyisoprenyl-phosphate glycosyltransferase